MFEPEKLTDEGSEIYATFGHEACATAAVRLVGGRDAIRAKLTTQMNIRDISRPLAADSRELAKKWHAAQKEHRRVFGKGNNESFASRSELLAYLNSASVGGDLCGAEIARAAGIAPQTFFFFVKTGQVVQPVRKRNRRL